MKCCNKKIWLIITLLIVIAGMVFLGVFGLNQTPDNGKSFEVRAGVDVDIDGSGKIAKDAAVKYFNDNNLKYAAYATQVYDDGAMFVFKFDTVSAPAVDTAALETAIQNALKANAQTEKLTAKVEGVYEVNVTRYGEVLGVTLAIGVAAVAALLYLMLTEKPAAAVASFCSALISAVLFLSIIAVARIPAYPAFTATLAFAFTLGLIFSAVLTNRFREVMKIAGNEKLDKSAIAAKGVKQGLARIIFVTIAVLFAALPLAVFGGLSLTFVALQLVAAAVAAMFAVLFWTPFLWIGLKK